MAQRICFDIKLDCFEIDLKKTPSFLKFILRITTLWINIEDKTRANKFSRFAN